MDLSHWVLGEFGAVASIIGLFVSGWAAVAATWASKRAKRVERFFVFQMTLAERLSVLDEADTALEQFLSGGDQGGTAAREHAAIVIVECLEIERYTDGHLPRLAKRARLIAGKLQSGPTQAREDAKSLKVALAGVRSAVANAERRFRSGETI